jgi:hypothetical protein
MLFAIEPDKHPVLFIVVKPPASSALDSKRKRADDQMRDFFRDLRHNLVTPQLHGISAFGIRSCPQHTPGTISPDPVYLNDVAPAERWGYDLLAHLPRMLDHGPNSLEEFLSATLRLTTGRGRCHSSYHQTLL